jgi:hypothetical protein
MNIGRECRDDVDIEHFVSTAMGAEDELPLKHEEDVKVGVPLLSCRW